MFSFLENYFDFKKHGVTLGSEIRSGSTTFMTMAYVMPVNALIMSLCGMPWDAVFTMTALFSGLATIWMGLQAKFPFAIAPGMGTNAIFAFSIVNAGVASWEVAMGMIFWAGMGIVVFSVHILNWLKYFGVKNEAVLNFCIREKVVKSIPDGLQIGFAAAIGMFLMSLGLGPNGMNLIAYTESGPVLGDITSPSLIIGLLGILVCAMLFWLKGKNFNVRGAILIVMLGVAAVMMAFGLAPLPEKLLSIPSGITKIAFRLNIFEALKPEYFPYILVFFMGDIFSTTGTALACVAKSGLNKNGDFDRWDEIFFVDAICAPGGAVAGLTTPTCYVESAAGITDGARTGMASLTTGGLFLISLFLLPVFEKIPPTATGVALAIVGIEMFRTLLPDPAEEGAKELQAELSKPTILVPLTLMIAITLLANDFASAMCIGLAAWVVMAAFCRFVLGQKDQLADNATRIMAVVILVMSVMKLVITI